MPDNNHGNIRSKNSFLSTSLLSFVIFLGVGFIFTSKDVQAGNDTVIKANDASIVNDPGGNITFEAGSGDGSGDGGDIILTPGSGGTTGNGGNVGIGLTNPTVSLHIEKAGKAQISVKNTTDSVHAYFGANTGTGTQEAFAGSQTNHDFTLFTNNTERVRITTDGHVGIGTTPGRLFHIKGSNAIMRVERTGIVSCEFEIRDAALCAPGWAEIARDLGDSNLKYCMNCSAL